MGPTPPKRSNGPGRAALIIGIVSMVLSLLPVVNFFSFVLGFAGLICGTIGLILTDRPRRQALWGTILSGVSISVAFFTVLAYTFGLFFVGGAISELTRDLPQASEAASPPTLPTAADPLPLGEIVELTGATGEPAYEATVTASVIDANDQVLGNARNVEAPAGMQWAMARVTVTSLSEGHSTVASEITLEYLSSDGHIFSADDEYVIAPEPEFAMLAPINVGETTTGNIVIAVPNEDPAGGTWALSYNTNTGTEPFYFEVG
ncbi:hypothetical protein D9V28_08295 [Mycetocola zhadangensis]|uniref:DUF4190 domain-containing protein n=1 Tax=Mycetocola zhadangensis TaxID=1164595 RepID=A0A3L7J133_9MICO|nr:hypothetical protein D9V28_08295 [Mycetocola zhadangensis]GGE95163.1 hypothetical protein GCM10011313_17650 [Mycetocola zhadangensis]